MVIALQILLKNMYLNNINNKENIVLKTKIYKCQFMKQDNLAQLIVDFVGSPIEAFEYLVDLESVYPNFYYWYHNTVWEDMKKGKNGRAIIIALSNVRINGNIEQRITGIAILKSNHKEKKICTLRVFNKYRSQGVGSLLLKYCFKYLGTKKPLISISQYSLKYFFKFIEKYNWKLVEILDGYYQRGCKEYVFNGKLSKSKNN